MYLGIIGKSGCDKIKISRLFGKTIVWIMTHLDSTSTPSFDYIYNFINWCNALNSDQKLEEDNEIYYASFFSNENVFSLCEHLLHISQISNSAVL